MNRAEKQKKNHFNAVDVMIVLFLVLALLGVTGRILLDRHNSSGIETRQIAFTMVLPEIKAEQMTSGATLYTEVGNTLGSIVRIDRVLDESTEEEAPAGQYVLLSGALSVRGYERKDGVFCTLDGEELRINTSFSLKNGQNVYFYISDIVKNGQ